MAALTGPLLILEGNQAVGYGERVEIRAPSGEIRQGRVLRTREDMTIVQVFQGTRGLSVGETRLRFLGEPFRLAASREMLGRVFDGTGRAIDGGPEPVGEKQLDVNGMPMNPVRRDYPRDVIQTGISSIDGMNTLVRGQKLPVFSGAGLPHNEIAAQIVRQATIGGEGGDFALVFAGMGIKNDDAHFFQESFRRSRASGNVAMFLNLASDPAEERILTPRCALTLAEFLAFEKEMHVLVILVDITNYCESLREIAAAREEVPSRKGYPGYMYSDLAELYERTGRVRGRKGSITQLPILSMPNMDITHPIPDLTGYITEGQIVLDRELYQKGIYPPVNVLPSLSRLMKDAIGGGQTREDHAHVSSQLYSAYAEAQRIRSLAAVIGEEELSEVDRAYLQFGNAFEARFTAQGPDENRTFNDTLTLGWELLQILPERVLTRVTRKEIEKYYHAREGENGEPAGTGGSPGEKK
jgi:V/A-type H+-transporting ATPase subunit B